MNNQFQQEPGPYGGRPSTYDVDRNQYGGQASPYGTERNAYNAPSAERYSGQMSPNGTERNTYSGQTSPYSETSLYGRQANPYGGQANQYGGRAGQSPTQAGPYGGQSPTQAGPYGGQSPTQANPYGGQSPMQATQYNVQANQYGGEPDPYGRQASPYGGQENPIGNELKTSAGKEARIINYTAGPESYERQPGETTSHYYGRRLVAIKPVEAYNYEASKSGMNRVLGRWDLIFIGIGAIIGTGIFVLSGHAAGQNAGPAVVISFIIAGIASALAALSYSELATMIPVAGSAYTYTYATMGEFVAWIIGWDLILEYAVGAATVAVGWSAYFSQFFAACGVNFSASWTMPPLQWNEFSQSITVQQGQYFNLPGVLIITILTILLIIGIRESATVNNIIVILKLVIVVVFIFGAAKWIDTANYNPFVPPNTGDWREFGVGGIFAAAQQIFFAYIGFDAVTTAAMESKDPPRDLPVGIIGSLVICTVLYIATAVVLTGVTKYTFYANDPAPIATATRATGQTWLLVIVTLGALAGLTSVILILLLGQSRIFYSMAKDGLLPSVFAKLHPRFHTPYLPTIITGFVTAILSALLPVDLLGNMTSVGTLLAFFLVHSGVLILRFTRPDIPRPFKVPGPGHWWMIVPILGAAISVLLIAVSDVTTIWRVFAWMGIGFIVYFSYGFWHSKINTDPYSAFEAAAQQDDAVL